MYNVGGTAALDVQVADNTFGPQDFETVGGQLKIAIGLYLLILLIFNNFYHNNFLHRSDSSWW